MTKTQPTPDAPRRAPKPRHLLGGACVLLFTLLSGCSDGDSPFQIEIPFMPQSKYVNVGGRKLTRAEVAYLQKIKDLSNHTKINPNDAVAYQTLGELFQAKGNYELAKELYVNAVRLDPALSEAHHSLGVIAVEEGRYRDALTDLQRAERLSPEDARLHMHLGQAFSGSGQASRAFHHFDKGLKLDDELTACYLHKGRLQYRMRKFSEAAQTCRDAIAHLPTEKVRTQARQSNGRILDFILPAGLLDNQLEEAPDTSKEEAHFNLALCLRAQGKLREAMTALAPAEATPYCRADVMTLKSRLMEGLGDLTGAINVLNGLRGEFPDLAEIPKRLARLYDKNRQPKEAAQARLDAAELDHSDRRLQLEAARVAVAQNNTPRAIAIFERLVRIDPDDISSLRSLARAYDQAGITRQAALTYQELVNRRKDDLDARRRLGMLYADLPGFSGRAVLQFKQVLEANPKDTEVHRRLGELYIASRAYQEAETHIRWTLELDPNDAIAHQNLATLYALQKRAEDSVSAYRKALRIKPDLYDANLNMAKVLVGIHRLDEALEPMETYLKAKPEDEEARRLYAATLRDLNRREEAVAQYQKIIELRPNDAVTAMELADLAALLGKKAEASGMYEALLEKNPANLEALRAAGRLYDSMDHSLRAMYIWQRVLKLRPQDLDARDRLAEIYKSTGDTEAAIAMYKDLGHGEAWRNVAFLQLKNGDREQAIEAYRKVIEQEKRDVKAREDLASLLQRSEHPLDRDEAMRLYQELIQLNNKDVRARLNLANLYNEDNRLAQAQEQYEELLRIDEKNAPARVGMGVVYRKRRKFKDAAEEYEKALKIDPNSGRVHYNLAVLYDFYLRDQTKAQFHYQRFVELGGDKRKLPGATPAPQDAPAPQDPQDAPKPASKGEPKPTPTGAAKESSVER